MTTRIPLPAIEPPLPPTCDKEHQPPVTSSVRSMVEPTQPNYGSVGGEGPSGIFQSYPYDGYNQWFTSTPEMSERIYHPMMPTYNPYSPATASASLWSPASTNEFKLCFRTGNISTCNGCRNKFSKKASLPQDLCIQHAEWRTFTSPSTQLPDSRFGNAYFFDGLVLSQRTSLSFLSKMIYCLFIRHT